MKTTIIIPALAAFLIVAGGSVLALDEDRDTYVVPETESGWLYSPPWDEPAPDVAPRAEPEPGYNGQPAAPNGDGEPLTTEPEGGIFLLPPPAPVEEAPSLNGEMDANGDLNVAPEANGEWREVEPNGEDTVTPYTSEEPKYEDRDAEKTGPCDHDKGKVKDHNGELMYEDYDGEDYEGYNGWYDHDGDANGEIEYQHNRTGYRWGWPGRK